MPGILRRFCGRGSGLVAVEQLANHCEQRHHADHQELLRGQQEDTDLGEQSGLGIGVLCCQRLGSLDIVSRDDQHGTAIVVLAALRNALRLVKKDLKDTKIVLSGAGAAGTAIARLLVRSGAVNIIGYDKDGVICKSTPHLDDEMRTWFIDNCNPTDFRGKISEAMKDADIFIGVSAPNVLTEADVASMAPKSIIFALANPDPEIDPVISRKYAAVVATGRSDQPNQINNVLAFPGIFRGLLDANAHKISDEMLVAAAEAIADCVSPEQLNASFIVPSVFDANVVKAVAAAVKKSV